MDRRPRGKSRSASDVSTSGWRNASRPSCGGASRARAAKMGGARATRDPVHGRRELRVRAEERVEAAQDLVGGPADARGVVHDDADALGRVDEVDAPEQVPEPALVVGRAAGRHHAELLADLEVAVVDHGEAHAVARRAVDVAEPVLVRAGVRAGDDVDLDLARRELVLHALELAELRQAHGVALLGLRHDERPGRPEVLVHGRDDAVGRVARHLRGESDANGASGCARTLGNVSPTRRVSWSPSSAIVNETG